MHIRIFSKNILFSVNKTAGYLAGRVSFGGSLYKFLSLFLAKLLEEFIFNIF